MSNKKTFTKEQREACNDLQKALQRCKKAGLFCGLSFDFLDLEASQEIEHTPARTYEASFTPLVLESNTGEIKTIF